MAFYFPSNYYFISVALLASVLTPLVAAFIGAAANFLLVFSTSFFEPDFIDSFVALFTILPVALYVSLIVFATSPLLNPAFERPFWTAVVGAIFPINLSATTSIAVFFAILIGFVSTSTFIPVFEVVTLTVLLIIAAPVVTASFAPAVSITLAPLVKKARRIGNCLSWSK